MNLGRARLKSADPVAETVIKGITAVFTPAFADFLQLNISLSFLFGCQKVQGNSLAFKVSHLIERVMRIQAFSPPADQCPSAPNHHLSSICASTDLNKAALEKLGLCLAWSRLSLLGKTCIYTDLKGMGNWSIFNKENSGQVNYCFQSHLSLRGKTKS